MGYQLGVDIGTTHTAAAVLRQGRAQMVTLEGDFFVIPSVIFLDTDGTVVVGETASRQGLADPTRVARTFKRRVGDATPAVLGGTPYSGVELMAKMLRRVVDLVSEREGAEPELVTITHPAGWGSDLVSQIVELAGVDDVRTISDQEAVAVFHRTEVGTAEGDVVVVYDLGGGTFDVAVARMSPDGVEIVGAAEGIERLGGVDFDEAVLAHISEAVDISPGDLDPEDPPTAAALAGLRAECAVVKEALSTATEVSVPVFLPGGQSEVRLTRNDLEELIRPALTKTIEVLHQALDAAHVAPGDVDTVMLVGGSSRIPLVARLVSEALDKPVAVDDEPKHAAALGAALSMVAQSEEPDGDADGDADGDGEGDAEATPTEALAIADGPKPVGSTGSDPEPAPATEEAKTSAAPVAAATEPVAQEPTPERPATPPMSLLTSVASVAVCLAMVAAAVGAGTVIARGQVGFGIGLVGAGVVALVALVLMLRKPSSN